MRKASINIPLLDLEAHHSPIQDEILAVIEKVIGSQNFILGPHVVKFEDQAAAYCQSKFAVGVSSGTDALLVALMALGVGAGDEVITTTYSFFATVGVVVRLGATPVFVDIDPVTYNLDPKQIDLASQGKPK